MGAIVLDDAEIGDDCIIGAGALVTKGTQDPAGKPRRSASPAKVVRALKPEELAFLPRAPPTTCATQSSTAAPCPARRDWQANDSDLRTNSTRRR